MRARVCGLGVYFGTVCCFSGLYMNESGGDEGVYDEGLYIVVIYTLCFTLYTCDMVLYIV